MRQVDLCVIGSGPAGQRAAIQAAKLGRTVCVVEKRDALGGAAINTGTIPSKALREAILHSGGRPGAHANLGDFASTRDAMFADLLRGCGEVIRSEAEQARRHLRSNGVVTLRGTGEFEDPHTVRIESGYGSERIRAEKIVIATGTRPARPEKVPFDDANIVTSDELITLDYLPRSIIVVGGGVIGTEYASMLSALDVRVTLVEARPGLLDFVDGELTEALQYHLRQDGMTLRLGEKVTKIELIDPPRHASTANQKMVQAALESDKILRADCLLYAIGRQGNTDELNLEAAGLEADRRGRITVSDCFQTSVPHIYACGDVIGFPALASSSMEQGRVAACHMFGESVREVRELLPYGIYSVPEISMVGWTEQRLTEEGVPYEAGVAHYREIARGKLLGDDIGMLKLLIHQETRHVLGVHAIGTGATELIHIGQAAIAFKATVDYFIDTVFNYPTLAECYKVAALNAVNKLRST